MFVTGVAGHAVGDELEHLFVKSEHTKDGIESAAADWGAWHATSPFRFGFLDTTNLNDAEAVEKLRHWYARLSPSAVYDPTGVRSWLEWLIARNVAGESLTE